MSKRHTCCSIAIVLLLICSSAARADTTRRYTVTDFGAVGNGATVNTPALQSLIDKVSADGGGVIVIPSGTFMTGALFFKSGVSLFVDKDGVLKGTVNPADYPQVATRFEGVERTYTSALLNWDKVRDVSISGDGAIDGSGDLWMQRSAARTTAGATTAPAARGLSTPAATPSGRGATVGARGPTTAPLSRAGGSGARGVGPATTAPSANLLARGATTAPAGRAGTAAASTNVGRPRLICFSNSSNIRISDVHLIKPAIWCLHILYSQEVVVDSVTINAMAKIPSSDGVVVDSSSHVTISHCSIDCDDDDVSLKSGKDADGRRVNKPTEYVTITDCAFGSGEGIAMGSEVTGSILHVLVDRCKFNGTGEVVRIKSMASRGGLIEDVIYRDCQLSNVRDAFEFDMNWLTGQERAAPASVLTHVREFQVINVTGTAQQLGKLVGIDTTQLQDIKWVNCNITAQRPMTIDTVSDVDLSGLHATVASGKPFTVKNSDTILFPTTSPSAVPTSATGARRSGVGARG